MTPAGAFGQCGADLFDEGILTTGMLPERRLLFGSVASDSVALWWDGRDAERRRALAAMAEGRCPRDAVGEESSETVLVMLGVRFE
jgi:hypothetical protein